MGDLQDKITVKIEIKLTKCLVFKGVKRPFVCFNALDLTLQYLN